MITGLWLIGVNSIGLSAVIAADSSPQDPGQVDLQFDPGTDVVGPLNAIALQQDGKVLAAGNSLVRLNSDGSHDTSFLATNLGLYPIWSVVVQPDQKILVGGAIAWVMQGPSNAIVRLNADGSRDTGFDTSNIVMQTVNALALQPDGKILAALTVPAYATAPIVVRLHSDGRPDAAFNPWLLQNYVGGAGSGPYPSYTVAVDNDGKIFGTGYEHCSRFLPGGALDPTFAQPRASLYPRIFSVYTLAVQANGRILIGGSFTNLNGSLVAGLARLHPDGSVDTSFATRLEPVSLEAPVNVIQVQPDGKVLITGSFTNVNGIARRGLARLNADGSLDQSFALAGSVWRIKALVLRQDGRIIVGGNFSQIGGVPRGNIAQLYGEVEQQPVIVTQPASQTLSEGQRAMLYVENTSSPPVEYQWHFNGVPIEGATQSRLILDSVRLADAGEYTVTVSNTLGAVTSDLATLTVQPASTHPGSLAPEPVPSFGANGQVLALLAQSDGCLILGGRFTSVQGVPCNRLARLLPDGSVDPSFGLVFGEGKVKSIHALATQSDTVLVAGDFWFIDALGRTNRYVARFNSDGSLDTTFSTGNSIDGPVYALLPQPNGRILIGGDFWRVARLNGDGSWDASFTSLIPFSRVAALAQKRNGQIVMAEISGYNRPFLRFGTLASNTLYDSDAVSTSGPINALAVLPDDSLIVGGAFTNIAGCTRHGIAQLDPNRTVHSNFSQTSFTSATVNALLPLACGKVVVGGSFTNVNGLQRVGLARLNPEGTLDQDYYPGTGLNGMVMALAHQMDGRIAVGGEFSRIDGSVRNNLARLNADPFVPPFIIVPTPDQPIAGGANLTLSFEAGCWPLSTFQWMHQGTNLPGATNTSLRIANFRFLNAGQYSLFMSNALGQATSVPVTVAVTQSVSAGSLDLDFVPSISPSNRISALALHPDGRILVACSTNFHQVTWWKVDRLHTGGSLDTSLVSREFYYDIRLLTRQDDGKALITQTSSLQQMDSDGTPIPDSFAAFGNSGSSAIIHAVEVDPEGRILVGGDFTEYRGVSRRRLARLLPSGGILDTNFLTGAGADATVFAVAHQTDGRILIAGSFSTFDNVPRKLIARLNADGSLDPDFRLDTNVTANSYIASIGLQTDGKIIVCGPFEFEIGGSRLRRVARLLPDGTLDRSFNADLNISALFIALAVQSNNQVLLAGEFFSPDGSTRKLIRLRDDGSLDPTFNVALNGGVRAIVTQPDGRVLIAGDFTSVNGVPRNGIARLLGDVWLFNPEPDNGNWTFSMATIAGKTYTLESKDAVTDTQWIPRSVVLGNGAIQQFADPAPNPPHRFYRIRME